MFLLFTSEFAAFWVFVSGAADVDSESEGLLKKFLILEASLQHNSQRYKTDRQNRHIANCTEMYTVHLKLVTLLDSDDCLIVQAKQLYVTNLHYAKLC